jgi:hypothetical protein
MSVVENKSYYYEIDQHVYKRSISEERPSEKYD